MPYVEAFKAGINKSIENAPAHFSSGTRRGQVLHARIRLGCSSLNYDLHRRSLVESPLCSCGSIETASHYLLNCNSYTQIRTLFSDIPCPATINNLLYGNEHLSNEQNELLFESIQKFVIASKRF